MKETTVRSIRDKKTALGPCTVRGWVQTHRQSKNVSFIRLSDGSTVGGVQVVIEPDLESYVPVASKISTGASVIVQGELVESPGKGQEFEIHASEVSLIGEADSETYPLQKKGHTLEFLRENLHLRPRSNTLGAVFRIRSKAAMAIHSFYNEHDFVYLTAPIITTADCEGAGEMFQVTTMDLNNVPTSDGKVDYKKDFFKDPAHLTVSGQLQGEIFACSLGKTYTFGPTFRAENSNTTRHLSEFWMIEPEVAFYDLQDNMKLGEEFIKYILNYVLNECEEDLAFLHEREWCEEGLLEALQQVATAEFKALDYTDAIEALEKSGKDFEFPVSWGMDLQAEHEQFLSEEFAKGPVFIVNYPKEIKAFYMRANDDGKTVRAMDLLVPRLGEIIGGSQREERLDVLAQKLKENNLPEEEYWWYLDLRRYGSVPHSGFGLGFERFLMYVTGMKNIRDVTPFPRHPGFAKF